MPLYDYQCSAGHRAERLAKMSEEILPCNQEGCTETARRDEIPQIRHLDKLGMDANYCSVRFNFNWISN